MHAHLHTWSAKVLEIVVPPPRHMEEKIISQAAQKHYKQIFLFKPEGCRHRTNHPYPPKGYLKYYPPSFLNCQGVGAGWKDCPFHGPGPGPEPGPRPGLGPVQGSLGLAPGSSPSPMEWGNPSILLTRLPLGPAVEKTVQSTVEMTKEG